MELKPTSTPKRSHWGVWLSIAAILLMILVALFAQVIAPYHPTKMQIGQSNWPPIWYDSPLNSGQSDHILGTDRYGRDVYSHVIYGARAAIFLVLIAIPLAALIGVLVGVTAGLGNQLVETIFLRLTDMASSVPAFMFTVIIILILRPTPTGMVFGGLITMTLAFALVNWVGLARLLYTSILKIKHQEFMEASKSLGADTTHQIFKHILPHLSHLIVVWVVNNVPAVILLEALLGYIGVQILQVSDGTSFQDLSWGGLIFVGRSQLSRNPFILLVPTLCIRILAMSFSILGEYLNEKLNPQLESNEII